MVNSFRFVNPEMQLKFLHGSLVEPRKEKHVIWRAKNQTEGKHSRRNGSKRCISKAYSMPGTETREAHNVETEG